MKMHWLGRASVVAFAAFTLASGTVMAQVYPAKRIRIVVPYPAGGGVDTVVRMISSKLSENLRQPILIDNRPGATGNIGTEEVAKAAPDGYTLLGAFSSIATNAAIYTNLPFDTVKDFAPITLLGVAPGLLTANVSMPVKTVKDVVALAKKRPGEIIYSSSPGPGSPAHLAMELFNMLAGVKMTHVPYKGGPQSLVALISGEVQLTLTTVDIILPHVKSGKLRPIAVASLKRFRLLPNIPTIDESGVRGLRGYETNAWRALLAPAKTPRPIIEQLHGEVVKVLQGADIRESFLLMGLEPMSSTPEQLHALIKAEIEKWAKVVKATGVKID